VAVSGQASGPDLAPLLVWLGRDRLLRRIQATRVRFETADG